MFIAPSTILNLFQPIDGRQKHCAPLELAFVVEALGSINIAPRRG